MEPDIHPHTDRLSLMLAALASGFVLSMSFRTIIAISADPLATQFGASPQALGALAGVFHLAFASAQPFVGVALDRYSPRRVVLVTFLLALIGCVISSTASYLSTLVFGQILIGLGCSPALLAAMLFISQRYPADRFAAVSGVVLSTGGAGMLLTGTPLAWVIDTFSWRAGFNALFLLAILSWLAVLCFVDESPTQRKVTDQTFRETLGGLWTIVRQPHTLGICCLAATSYAAFLTLRGLWLGPLLTERYSFSLIEVGHAAFAVSLVAIFGPLYFGRLDPGGRARRKLIVGCSLGFVLLFILHAVGLSAPIALGAFVITGFLVGYVSLQYADVRTSYPDEMTGRAFSVFTMAMFAGVAGVQWLSGIAATFAPRLDLDPMFAALLTVSALLFLGTLAFSGLPQPRSCNPEFEASD